MSHQQYSLEISETLVVAIQDLSFFTSFKQDEYLRIDRGLAQIRQITGPTCIELSRWISLPHPEFKVCSIRQWQVIHYYPGNKKVFAASYL